ncbi:MAG: hypothetical protein QOF25_1254, partial [Mycobacterium sp.]|nr:hypothetical protein [Mycobacterium sp.]
DSAEVQIAQLAAPSDRRDSVPGFMVCVARRRTGADGSDPRWVGRITVSTFSHGGYLTSMPVGTVIWTAPWGEKFVTHPGSALIFPALCIPTGPITPTAPERSAAATTPR